MKKKILLLMIGVLSSSFIVEGASTTKVSSNNQKNNVGVLDEKISAREFQEIKDRMELKKLVDTFSNLADTKEVDKQVLLFTEDATVQTIQNGVPSGSKFTGQKEIEDAFSQYLELFETVYHINGQHTVEINGDTATGINYCQVVLISNDNGKRIKNTSGVRYNDTYKKINGKWYISDRKSDFMWRTSEEIKQ